ncbi:MAG: nuclease-related domain-containing protein [Phycisphaeraceae bacterium]
MIAIEFAGVPPQDSMGRAGYDAEKQLAFYLKRAFQEPAYDFRVFNGLRVIRRGEVAQIDHLILHRFGFVLVESKSIAGSVNINSHGEFTRWYGKQPKGIPSPIAQAKRQSVILKNMLNDAKGQLRRKVGIGPLKQQAEFSDGRFKVIAAISDNGRITHEEGDRPPEIMKAEAVVDAVQKVFDDQQKLTGVGGFARTFVNRENKREWGENYLPPFTNDEIEAITDMLVAAHTPLAQPAAVAPTQVDDKPPSTSPPSSATSPTPTTKRKPPERNLRRWTEEEERRLREAFAAGRSPTDLVESFGRTAKALRLRAVKLGLSPTLPTGHERPQLGGLLAGPFKRDDRNG